MYFYKVSSGSDRQAAFWWNLLSGRIPQANFVAHGRKGCSQILLGGIFSNATFS
jgi:hypothetical protein